MARQHAWQGDMCGRGACVEEVCVAEGGMAGGRDTTRPWELGKIRTFCNPYHL